MLIALPLCPLLLTIAAPVLSLIALYTVSSGKYLEFQNVFYRKCLAFTLINKFICILTETHDVERTLKAIFIVCGK